MGEINAFICIYEQGSEVTTIKGAFNSFLVKGQRKKSSVRLQADPGPADLCSAVGSGLSSAHRPQQCSVQQQPHEDVPACRSSGQQPSPSLGQHSTPVPGARCSQSFWPSALSALVTILSELTPAVRGCSGCLY